MHAYFQMGITENVRKFALATIDWNQHVDLNGNVRLARPQEVLNHGLPLLLIERCLFLAGFKTGLTASTPNCRRGERFAQARGDQP
jgi:hypothetical protein